MPGRVRVPLAVVALLLFGLIALLGTLQYRWLGQISESERDRMRASLTASAEALARDVDGELTRAYLLFQAVLPGVDPSQEFPAQYDRWQAAARFPRLIAGFYRFTPGNDGAAGTLERFDPAARALTPVDWPPSMADWAARFPHAETPPSVPGKVLVRRLAGPIWETVPALVVPAASIVLPDGGRPPDLAAAGRMTYAILTIDTAYLSGEVLPALVAEHFRQPDDAGIRAAVVKARGEGPVLYRSPGGWTPSERTADVAVGLFAIRTDDFDRLASEVHRITTLATTIRFESAASPRKPDLPPGDGPVAIFVQGTPESGPSRRTVTTQISAKTTPAWRLVVQHPSGSLETAVSTARRRNLLVSSSILAVLGASMGLLVISTRRAQRLARQQMEFVATVSHELRTPLAVIRSAADNLAEGVVHDDARIRTYGTVMRAEGRRLTDMVEQILEFAGMASGQRPLRRDPVPVAPLLREVVDEAVAVARHRPRVEFDVPADLPAVAGDEGALRRVFQNLVGNAVKYGGDARWIGITARREGREVRVTIADRGIGIEAAEQRRIFEPFYRGPAALAAQIQGAGLGLSLVQRIVTAHGGRVRVESAPGAGASFTVHLATADDQPAIQTQRAPAPPAGAGAPRYS